MESGPTGNVVASENLTHTEFMFSKVAMMFIAMCPVQSETAELVLCTVC